MKIIILSDFFPPYGQGGAEIAAYRLAKGYLKKGHQVVVITTVQDKNLAARGNYEGLAVYRLYAKYHPRWRAYLSLYNPIILSGVKKIIQIEKPAVAHAHNIHYYFSYGSLRMIRKMNLPLVLTIHDVMPIFYQKLMPQSCASAALEKFNLWQCFKEQRWRCFPWRNYCIRHCLKNYPDKVIAVSNELKILLANNGLRCDGFIHHGIEPEAFSVSEAEIKDFQEKFNLQNKKIIFFGGRLSPAKGAEQLIKAVHILTQKRNDVLLLIAGPKDDYADKLMSLISELKIEDRVKIVGWLEKSLLAAAYASAYMVVYPSLCFDTFGLMNLEAMVMKKPVIATCFGGSKEIIKDNDTGYVINPLDIENMSQKMSELLDRPFQAEQMGRAGYKRFLEKFTLDKEVKGYLRIFKDI